MRSLLERVKNKLPVPIIRTLFPAASPLLDLPWQPLDARQWAQWGRVLVVSPHQDDESLGCGGLIARLRADGRDVAVVFISDGSGSHRNSVSHPPERLKALREQEAIAALGILGVEPQAIAFLGLRDGFVPFPGDPAFADAIERFCRYWQGHAADTVLLPWRHDPAPDHQASWHIAHAALSRVAAGVRILEYPIWAWAKPPEASMTRDVAVWRLDIRDLRRRKRRAISAHRSQTTKLIRDDKTCFRLQRIMQAKFDQPWELFFEAGRLSRPAATP
jgi:LmbE family N-acetylglucosaminyl deacetylase